MVLPILMRNQFQRKEVQPHFLRRRRWCMDSPVIQGPWSNFKALCEHNIHNKFVSNRKTDLDREGTDWLDLSATRYFQVEPLVSVQARNSCNLEQQLVGWWLQRSAKVFFLGCVTRPCAERWVTQPRKKTLADLCIWPLVVSLRIPTTRPRGFATSQMAKLTPWHSPTAFRTGSRATMATASSSAGSATPSLTVPTGRTRMTANSWSPAPTTPRISYPNL